MAQEITMKQFKTAGKDARLRARRARQTAKLRARGSERPQVGVWILAETPRAPRGWDWA